MKEAMKRPTIPWSIKFGAHDRKRNALAVLREALLREDYETCANLINIAKEYGAVEKEIGHLLEDARRVPG